MYLVVPCVTLNRTDRDTEIVCGFYLMDHRSEQRKEAYFGLEDDPAAYKVRYETNRLRVRDDQLGTPRPARDHRQLVLEQWRQRQREPLPEHEQLEEVRRAVADRKHHHNHYVRPLLRTLLLAVGQVSPVTAAVLLFAQGAVGIHHAYRAHRLARELAGDEEARKILQDVHAKVDNLDPDHARALIELLMNQYES